MPESRVCGNPEDCMSGTESSQSDVGYADNIQIDSVDTQHGVDTPHQLELGCIFCKTGQEEAAARLLNTTPRMHNAFVPKKVEHRSQKGVKSTTQKVFSLAMSFSRQSRTGILRC